MSANGGGDDRPRREVAWRVFAAEFDDADYDFAESDEERAPNYVVTPTGARINRLFAVGVLTAVEQVSDEVVRARVVDPTGAFVVYAGQYQPDALAALENASVPSFVAVTGKARTFSPEDADRVFTSIRPESVNEVTAETRDRWVVTTAERTLGRVAVFAEALDRPERGAELKAALAERGVPNALASGIERAIDHYETTPAYLAAVRALALDAVRVVAGDLEEVDALSLAPDEGDGTDADLRYDGKTLADLDATAAASGDDGGVARSAETRSAESATADAESGGTEETEATTDETEVTTDETETTTNETEATTDETEAVTDATETSAGETDADETEAAADETEVEANEASTTSSADDETEWEMDAETREEVEAEFDVDFSTGSDIPDAGEAPTGASDEADDGELGDFEPSDFDADDPDEIEDVEEYTEEEYDEPESDLEDGEAAMMEMDIEDVVVDYMNELDDGNGADRDDLVRTVLEDTDADETAIEDAIQSALMGGRCYEAGDDHLKAI